MPRLHRQRRICIIMDAASFLEEEENFNINEEIREKIFQNIQKQLNININAVSSRFKSK